MKNWFVVTIIFLIANQSFSGTLTQEFYFSENNLHFTKLEGYDLVKYGNLGSLSEIGKPYLPVLSTQILLPSNARITGWRVIPAKQIEIPGEYTPYPVQPPIPLVEGYEPSHVPPDETIYSSSSSYPRTSGEVAGSGWIGGYQVANLLLYPLQWLPTQKKLILSSTLRVEIQYEEGAIQPKALSRTQLATFGRLLENIVSNSEMLREFAPPQRALPEFSRLLPPDTIEYVIITPSAYSYTFQELADWKTKKGVPATVVDLEYITTNYTGDDTQEKIRNFIIDAESSWGTIYFLLAGDPSNNLIPTRLTTDFGLGPYGNIACDLYFSDLDGTWDGNNNGTYGQTSDGVDMYADVFVGRASIESESEASKFVEKVLTYEKNPPLDYLQKELLPAELLFPDYNYWGDTVNNIIADLTPANFMIVKLYESLGNLNAQAVLDSIESGYHFVHYASHGNYNVISTGPNAIYSSDADGLTNGDLLGIHTAICCIVGRLDYEDCIVEHFMNNPNGGTLAWIGNSRYGWGYIPGPGPSENLDIEFFDKVFNSQLFNIGAIHAAARDAWVPTAMTDQYYRYCIYEQNLFGDPEMPVWTATPSTMAVDHPQAIPLGESQFDVIVSHDGVPVEGALVCIMGEGVYNRGYTNPSGLVTLTISPESVDTLDVTVTAHNYLPYEGNTIVIAEGPFVVHQSHVIDDTEGGNGDGVANPGETIQMSVTVKNEGLESALDVQGVLRTDDSLVTIIDSLQLFGDIPPGGVATSSDSYVFTVDSSCEDGHQIHFLLTTTDTSANNWTSEFSIIVAAPVLSYANYSIDDSQGGNGNGVAEPGESVDIIVSLANTGSATATNVFTNLSTDDPYITVNISSSNFGEIGPGEEKSSINPFNISIAPDCSNRYFPTFNLTITADNYSTSDQFSILVATPGFSDNIEGELGEWNHYALTPGYTDEWHWETSRYQSPLHSWKCGGAGYSDYQNLVDAALVTPLIILMPEARLTFWHWMDAETYSTTEAWDGGIVEVSTDDGETWEQITPVGGYPYTIHSNPASPFPAGTPCFSGSHGWTQAEFDLSTLSGVVRFRFRFGTDGAVTEEGWYIDNIVVEEAPHPEIQVEPLSLLEELSQGQLTTVGLSIGNTGNETLDFNIQTWTETTFKNGWLDVEPSSGTLAPDSTTEITVTLDATGLGVGTYSGGIDILSNDPGDSLVTVGVELNVISPFVRGDVDGDYLSNMSDAVYILRYKFVPGSPPPSCMDAADADDDGNIGMKDAAYILRFQFVPESPPPPPPFPECGVDPTEDELGCDWHPCGGGVIGIKKTGNDRNAR